MKLGLFFVFDNKYFHAKWTMLRMWDLAILLIEVKSELMISVKSSVCGKIFDSA